MIYRPVVEFPFSLVCFCRLTLTNLSLDHQGLGLLINLVEYSSRNRHILVEMDYALSEGCLDDSSLGPPAEPAPAGQGEEPAVPCQGAEPAVPCQGEEPAVPCQEEEPALLGQAEEPAAPVQGQGEEPVGKGEEPAAPVPGEPSADDEDKPPATGALAALVKVGIPPGPTPLSKTLLMTSE